MTQNMSINAMLMPRIMDIPQKSTSNVRKNDDTFMSLLSERIQARRASDVKNRPLEKADKLPAHNNELENVEKKSSIEDSDSGKVEAKQTNTREAAKTEDLKADSGEDETQHDPKETIMTLESMVSLLEELLARLEVKTVNATAEETNQLLENPQQVFLPISSSEEVSPVELLKALLEGDVEKIKTLLGKMEESEQTPGFKSLLESIKKMLDKTEDGSLKALLDLNLEVESQEITKGAMIDQLKAQCREVIEKLQGRISELKNAAPQDQKIDGEALSLVESISAKSELSGKPQLNDSKDQQKTDVKGEEPKVQESEGKAHHTSHTQKPGQEKLVPENENSAENFSIPAEQKPSQMAAEKIDKTPFPLSGKPLAQTVTNQVMMKVKLMAGENKQELVMNLKPESLGKLSLKIIHERGEILAKITAESEQVKGILESNMQLLKDALEKSGLSVQSLSVSVGNGNENNQTKQNLNENNGAGMRKPSMSEKASLGTEGLYSTSRVRDFYDNDSQINLTA